MKQCPYCGCEEYEIETVNQAEMKKCSACGAFYEDAGAEFEINSFVPVYERDSDGKYPGCPKCGCRDIRRLTMDELLVRGNIVAAVIAGEPHELNPLLLGRYECRNPDCRHRWN